MAICSAVMSAAIASFPTASTARADAFWINGASNLWSNPNNWSPTGVPGPNEVLHIFGPGGVIQQDIEANFPVAGITFGTVSSEIAGQSIALIDGGAVLNGGISQPQRISAPLIINSAATLGGGTGNANDTIRFDDLRGSGNVTIGGAVTIFGATYTGTTTIPESQRMWIGGRQDGSFPPPGQTSGQGDYIVNGSLIGRGTIGLASGAAVRINSTGLVSAGIGVSTGIDLSQLTIDGALVVNSGGDVTIETTLAGTNYFSDRIDVNGVLDLSAVNDNLFIGNSGQFGSTSPTPFVVMTYQSRIGEFDLLNNGTNPNYQIVYTSAAGAGPGQVIILTPEPSAGACLFAVVSVAVRRRIRSNHATG